MSNAPDTMPTLRDLLAAIPLTRRNEEGVVVHEASADEDQTLQIEAIRTVLEVVVNRLEPTLDAVLEQAAAEDPGDLFPNAPAPAPEPTPDPMGDALERQRIANARLLHKDDDLNPQAPSDWDMDGQGVVEAMPAVSNVPPEIAALLDDGETLTRDVRRKLTERLNVELAELKNLRGLAGEDLKREAEIEKLLGLFARLGEI